jgi:hypothetical protein
MNAADDSADLLSKLGLRRCPKRAFEPSTCFSFRCGVDSDGDKD